MNENKFEYTYHAISDKEKRVVSSIIKQYDDSAKSVDAYEEIIRLDKRIKGLAQAMSLVVGIIGALIFGLGLAMVLQWQIYVWGILVSLVGIVPIALAYFIYRLFFNIGKKKYGKRILELSSSILEKEE